jgi:hypothetical protein
VGTPILINMAFYVPNENPSQYTAIMTLFASIIGGSITLIGIVWSVHHQRKIQNETIKEMKSEKYSDIIIAQYASIKCHLSNDCSFDEYLGKMNKDNFNFFYPDLSNNTRDFNSCFDFSFFYESIHYPIKEILISDVSTKMSPDKPDIKYSETSIPMPKNTIYIPKDDRDNQKYRFTISLINSPIFEKRESNSKEIIFYSDYYEMSLSFKLILISSDNIQTEQMIQIKIGLSNDLVLRYPSSAQITAVTQIR